MIQLYFDLKDDDFFSEDNHSFAHSDRSKRKQATKIRQLPQDDEFFYDQPSGSEDEFFKMNKSDECHQNKSKLCSDDNNPNVEKLENFCHNYYHSYFSGPKYDNLSVQEKKRVKFHRNKMTSTHQVLYGMRDQLSAREEDHCLGTSLGEADDVPSEKFFKGSFEEMKSARLYNHN